MKLDKVLPYTQQHIDVLLEIIKSRGVWTQSLIPSLTLLNSKVLTDLGPQNSSDLSILSP
jgi:hypothetical protein